MKVAPMPKNESARITTLHSLDILDTATEKVFDELTSIASQVCKTPIALISLVDSNRQWFKAKTCLRASDTIRDHAFCSHAILQDEIFIIEDSSMDMRFFDNPLVTGNPQVKFYAGVPLKREDGSNIGTLCVMDTVPRKLSKTQIQMLKSLASITVNSMSTGKKVDQLTKFSIMLEEIHELSLRGHKDKKLNLSIGKLLKIYLEKAANVIELEFGIISKIEDNSYYVEQVICPNGEIEAGTKFDLSDTYCKQVVDSGETVAFEHVGGMRAMKDHPVYVNMKLESYIGTPIFLHEKIYGTLNFSSKTIRKNHFSKEEKKFLKILAQTISKELEINIANEETEKSLLNLKNEQNNTTIIQRRLELATKAANVGVWDWNIEDNTFSYNETLLTLYGIPEKDGEVTYENWLQTILEEDREYVRSQLDAAIEKSGNLSVTFRVLKDNNVRFINFKGQVHFHRDRRPSRIIGVNIDITKNKKHEESLIKAKENALSAFQAKSVFLANMSHEIRTPLNSIVGHSEMLKEAKLNKENTEYVKLIHSSSHHLLNIVNDILDLSKIEADEIELQSERFNIKSEMQKVLISYAWQIEEKRLEVETNFEEQLHLDYKGDSSRYRQILNNIIGNAIKFTQEGRVKISVGSNRFAQKNGNILIKVEDTGIGIENKNLVQVFKSFSQVEAQSDKRFGGTGLGLSLSKTLVGLMGGEIWVRSKLGVGSCFFLTMSLDEIDEIGPDEAALKLPFNFFSNGTEFSKLKLNILLVDDAPNNRHLVKAFLKDFKFTITEVENGLEALNIMKEKDFDLVLMDMQMPEMDGFTATKLYREFEKKELRKYTPIIALTAYVMEEEKRRCWDAGCDIHLPKPITKNKLIEIMNECYLGNTKVLAKGN